MLSFADSFIHESFHYLLLFHLSSLSIPSPFINHRHKSKRTIPRKSSPKPQNLRTTPLHDHPPSLHPTPRNRIPGTTRRLYSWDPCRGIGARGSRGREDCRGDAGGVAGSGVWGAVA